MKSFLSSFQGLRDQQPKDHYVEAMQLTQRGGCSSNEQVKSRSASLGDKELPKQAEGNGENCEQHREVLQKEESNCIKGFRQRETDGRYDVLHSLTSWMNNCCQGRNNKSRIWPVWAAAMAFGSGHAFGGEEEENKYGVMVGNKLALHRWTLNIPEMVTAVNMRS